MFTAIQDALWLVQPALHAGIVFLMWRNGAFRRMPLFFSYNLFNAVLQVVAYVVLHWVGYDAYFYTYWSTTPIGELLAFGIIYELFSTMFRHREGLKDFGSMLFRWAIVVMVLMSALLAASSAGFGQHQFMQAVMSLERSIQVIMLGLLLFLLIFARHLGITLHHRVFGIVLGWGLASAVELFLYTGRASFHLSQRSFNYLHLGVYDATLIIWVCYAAVKEPAEVLPNMLLRSQRWNEALLEHPQHEQQAPLLHGIESLVDEAMTRNRR